MSDSERVVIREVGPRDGLQAEAPLGVPARVELIEQLIGAGLDHIEITAFMRDDRVPSMANAEDVVQGVPPRSGLTRYGLVANLKGAQRAISCGIKHLTVTVSLSEQYSQKNVGISSTESLRHAADITAFAHQQQCSTDVVISCSFGSPFNDVNVAHDLLLFFSKVQDTGATQITLADTTGVATTSLLQIVVSLLGINFGLHLHDNHGTALTTAYAAVKLGIKRFDTSVGGIGGSPFAPGAMGNLATESLVNMLDELGIETGISLSKLLDVGQHLQQTLGRPLPSSLLQAGPN